MVFRIKLEIIFVSLQISTAVEGTNMPCNNLATCGLLYRVNVHNKTIITLA